MSFNLDRFNELKAMPEELRKALVLVGEPTAVAFAWLKSYEDQINAIESYDEDYHSEVSLEEMIQCAESHQGGKWGDYISQGGRFESYSTDPLFYHHLRILVGDPNIEESNFFSCSC